MAIFVAKSPYSLSLGLSTPIRILSSNFPAVIRSIDPFTTSIICSLIVSVMLTNCLPRLPYPHAKIASSGIAVVYLHAIVYQNTSAVIINIMKTSQAVIPTVNAPYAVS